MKRFWILAFLGFCLAVSLVRAAEQEPLSFETFMQIKRVSDPQISPDGTQVAFVVTEMDVNKNRSHSDIWILPMAGGEAVRLTTSPGADSRPRWSPDGKMLAFISSRSGSPQIWLLSPQGGEARQLTHVASGASGVIWAPDGKHLAFASSVYPEYADEAGFVKEQKRREADPVKAQLFTELLYRHWNAWREGLRSHVFVIPVHGGKAKDVTPGDFDSPPISLGSSNDYAFAPDGKEIAFVRNEDSELRKGLGTNNDLFFLSLEKDHLEGITQANKANDNGIYYSPDGRYLAYRAMSRPGFEADRYQLMLYDRVKKTVRSLTKDRDFSVSDILWSPDSRSLYITYQHKAWDTLALILVEDSSIQTLLEKRIISSPGLSSDGTSLVFLSQNINLPPEIFSMKLKSRAVSQLTHVNDTLLQSLEMPAADEFWFTGAADDPVHGLLIKPPQFDPSLKYPLVCLIHGGPQGAWMDNFHFRWNAQMFAAPGYVVAMINFHGSTGYGQDFTDSITGDWGGKPFVDIEKGLDYLLEHYAYLDADRLSAAGASYGGYMINWIEGHSHRFRCLISHAGVYDLRSMHGATEEVWFPEWEFKGPPWDSPEQYSKWSPSMYVKEFQTPCLVIHGQLDFRVPVTQGFQLFTALQRQNIPSQILYFPDEGHFIQKPQNAKLWWGTMLEWLAGYLKN